jgi:hypothetical protein
MRRLITGLVLASLFVIATVAPTFAAKPPTGTLWLDGQLVRTIVPPAAAPQTGRDALYRVQGTGGVAAVGPGDKGYHGGKWAVYDVTFTDDREPFALTSEDAILRAEEAGFVVVVRNAADDFKCPIQGR